MSVRKEDQLQTISDLSAHTQSIPKACTVGIIVDSTNAYFDEAKIKYVKKIKLVDDTYNSDKYNPHQKYSYLTVFFYAPKIEDLPNPNFIGDLLYLRRFSFGKYNGSFQGHYLEAQYCSWAIISSEGDEVDEYQSSRVDMNLSDEEKYPKLSWRVKELRHFSKEYLSTTSVISILPTGITPKDTDVIVQVTKKNEDGYRLSDGKNDLILGDIISFAEEGQIAKLRSVARFKPDGKTTQIIPNNFTSLVCLREWTYDAQKFLKYKASKMDIETEGDIYTTLSQLNSMPLKQCENKRYNVKVEVASSSVSDFENALRFYDQKRNTLENNQKKDTVPVYKFNFVCLDESVAKKNQFCEIWLFSFDGQGGDFVERVRLEDLSVLSNYSQESRYFEARLQEILNAESVKMTVEVMSDGKGNRIFRALNIA